MRTTFIIILFTVCIGKICAQEYNIQMYEVDERKGYNVRFIFDRECIILTEEQTGTCVFESKFHTINYNVDKETVMFGFTENGKPSNRITTDSQFFIINPSAVMCNNPYSLGQLYDLRPKDKRKQQRLIKMLFNELDFYELMKSGDVQDIKFFMSNLDANDSKRMQLSNHLALLMATQLTEASTKQEKKEVLSYALDPEIRKTIKKYINALKYPESKTQSALEAFRNAQNRTNNNGNGRVDQSKVELYSNDALLQRINDRIDNTPKGLLW